MDYLNAGGGEVLFVPRKTLDANPLQLMFLWFKWVCRGPFSYVWCVPVSQTKHTVLLPADITETQFALFKASIQALKQCAHHLSTPNTDSHNSLLLCSWQEIPPVTSSTWKAPSLTRQAEAQPGTESSVKGWNLYLFPTSEQQEWSSFSLWVKADVQSRTYHPKQDGKTFGGIQSSPTNPVSITQLSSVACACQHHAVQDQGCAQHLKNFQRKARNPSVPEAESKRKQVVTSVLGPQSRRAL